VFLRKAIHDNTHPCKNCCCRRTIYLQWGVGQLLQCTAPGAIAQRTIQCGIVQCGKCSPVPFGTVQYNGSNRNYGLQTLADWKSLQVKKEYNSGDNVLCNTRLQKNDSGLSASRCTCLWVTPPYSSTSNGEFDRSVRSASPGCGQGVCGSVGYRELVSGVCFTHMSAECGRGGVTGVY
jgi:hypothetical protein